MVETKRICNGTFGEVWLDGSYVGECYKAQGKVEFNKEEIKIECNEGVLTITAEKADEENDENKKYIRKERVYKKTSRSFSFADIDEDAIKAEFKNGTLLLTIPKKEKIETKKVISID